MQHWQRWQGGGRREGDEVLTNEMTEKHKLSQIYWLNKEKKMWQRELDRINNQSLAKGQDYTKERTLTGSSIGGKQEHVAGDKDELKRLIDEQQKKIDAEEKRMMEYILTIEDSLLRQIVHYRCVCLLPWNVVAMEIGGGNTADSVRMQFKRFMEK